MGQLPRVGLLLPPPSSGATSQPWANFCSAFRASISAFIGFRRGKRITRPSESAFICVHPRLNPVQRLFEVGNQVARVFEAQREAHEVVHDADAFPILSRVIEERHGGHLGDEAFGAAETRRDEEQFQPVNEAARGLPVAFQEKGDYAASAAHLRAGNAVIRM